MPDHPSLVSDHHGLHPLPDPSVAGPDPFEPCEVEVEIAGTWTRGRAQARRRVDQRWEVQVSRLIDTGQPGALAGIGSAAIGSAPCTSTSRQREPAVLLTSQDTEPSRCQLGAGMPGSAPVPEGL
jgi:hypothetical protein